MPIQFGRGMGRNVDQSFLGRFVDLLNPAEGSGYTAVLFVSQTVAHARVELNETALIGSEAGLLPDLGNPARWPATDRGWLWWLAGRGPTGGWGRWFQFGE